MDIMFFSDDDDDMIQGDSETAGAAPVDNHRHNAPLNNARSSSGKDPKWLAHEGSSDGAHGTSSSTEPGKDGASQKEREERIRLLRERQNEERQKKLEELKSQALAAQKFREQKEEERRRRIEELRSRDTDRRYQVEERKRQIWEAERDRREAILRKNQEREARIDSKRKNERSSIVFAFGSSTPRMLEPADTGGSFWGHRRATSTTNVMMFAAVPLTRRSSERELDGSKKRATSASGLDRKPEDDVKMSASMYEVFNWGTTPEANVVSNVPSQVDKPNDSTPIQGSNELHLNVAGQGFIPYRNSSKIGAVDEGSEASGAPGYNAPVNRRKTDLTPTIPSPRDGTPSRSLKSAPFSRSPGRAFSMSRLDQLSQPRRRPMACVDESSSANEKPGKPLGSAPASVSRSMSHLAAGKQRALRKSENTRSMSQLSAAPPVPPPRPTRAERLRQRAREMAREKGMRSGEVTPLPPSRPLSALSQQSVNSVQSGVSLRSRPIAAARKPRPFSIAVTGVTQEAEPRGGTYRHSISGEIRTSKAMTSSIERMDSAKPPLPKPHATRRPPTKPEAPPRKVTDRVKSASAKASPRITPKATPLQSPGSETAPSILHEQTEPKPELEIDTKEVVDVKIKVNEVVKETAAMPADPEKLQEIPTKSEEVAEVAKSTDVVEAAKVIEVVEKKEAVVEKQVEKPEVVAEEVDMTASMMAKTRITTEGEAKAALAERRRLAREQAEREAELERQRVEAERLAEEERMIQEEEEQRRFEEEQMRLLEETRKAEDERLLLAIQENEKREEEEKKRREEEAQAKIEKEEADKKAREEAERLRQEMDERLKKEEEERVARRKRVEAIMLRTRGKGTPANTPTKDGDSEGDEGKDESPTEETKTENDKSLILSAAASDNHVTGNGLVDELTREVGGGDKKVSSSSSGELLLIDNTNGKPMEISEEDLNIASEHTPQQQSNGHRNGMDYNSVDFVNVDNMKQNKTTSNNLLDFSEFETLSNDQSSTSASDLLAPTSGKFMNEDNVNSNIMNGPNAPFIAFSDNLTKKQDSNTVTDLLS